MCERQVCKCPCSLLACAFILTETCPAMDVFGVCWMQGEAESVPRVGTRSHLPQPHHCIPTSICEFLLTTASAQSISSSSWGTIFSGVSSRGPSVKQHLPSFQERLACSALLLLSQKDILFPAVLSFQALQGLRSIR